MFYQTTDGKKELKEEAKKLIIDQEQINEIFSEYKTLRLDHQFKYWVVDIGIPLIISVAAFSKISCGLIVFWNNI